MAKSNYEDLFTSDDIVTIDKYIKCIPWSLIEEKLWEEYEHFIKWMRWQTCMSQGVYVWDVKNYFYKRDTWKLDWFPHWF